MGKGGKKICFSFFQKKLTNFSFKTSPRHGKILDPPLDAHVQILLQSRSTRVHLTN